MKLSCVYLRHQVKALLACCSLSFNVAVVLMWGRNMYDSEAPLFAAASRSWLYVTSIHAWYGVG
jgi:hypothetical protein